MVSVKRKEASYSRPIPCRSPGEGKENGELIEAVGLWHFLCHLGFKLSLCYLLASRLWG